MIIPSLGDALSALKILQTQFSPGKVKDAELSLWRAQVTILEKLLTKFEEDFAALSSRADTLEIENEELKRQLRTKEDNEKPLEEEAKTILWYLYNRNEIDITELARATEIKQPEIEYHIDQLEGYPEPYVERTYPDYGRVSARITARGRALMYEFRKDLK